MNSAAVPRSWGDRTKLVTKPVWLVVEPTPLKNHGVKVSWVTTIPNISKVKNKSMVPVTTNQLLFWQLSNLRGSPCCLGSLGSCGESFHDAAWLIGIPLLDDYNPHFFWDSPSG